MAIKNRRDLSSAFFLANGVNTGALTLLDTDSVGVPSNLRLEPLTVGGSAARSSTNVSISLASIPLRSGGDPAYPYSVEPSSVLAAILLLSKIYYSLVAVNAAHETGKCGVSRDITPRAYSCISRWALGSVRSLAILA